MAELRFPNEGSIPEFLAALASPEDTHGALAAAAMAGAMGASLLQMVAALPQTLPRADDEPTALVRAIGALVRVQEELLETIETETAVKLFAARNMPQASKTERAERESAIQLALRAADVPLEIMRLCGRALQHAETVAGRSARAASIDVELAVTLLETAFNAALQPRSQATDSDQLGACDVDRGGDCSPEPRYRCCCRCGEMGCESSRCVTMESLALQARRLGVSSSMPDGWVHRTRTCSKHLQETLTWRTTRRRSTATVKADRRTIKKRAKIRSPSRDSAKKRAIRTARSRRAAKETRSRETEFRESDRS